MTNYRSIAAIVILATIGMAFSSFAETETEEVRPDVDLSKQKIGAKVVFETTTIVALSVEKK